MSVMDELIVTRQAEAPQYHKMHKSLLVLGRDASCDIVLAGQAVSRQHVRLEQVGDSWQVVDLGSTNGSYLGRERIPKGSTQLWRPGHPLQIGPYTLQWHASQRQQDLTLALAPNEVKEIIGEEVSQLIDLSGEINLHFAQEKVVLKEESAESVKVGILSASQLTHYFQVEIRGVPAEWYTISHPLVTLQPKKHFNLVITFQLPPSSFARGGDYPYQIIFKEVHAPFGELRCQGTVAVPSLYQFETELAKRPLTNRGRLHLSLRNVGNVTDTYQVTLLGQNGTVRAMESEWLHSLMPDASTVVQTELEAVRPLIGRITQHPIELSIQAENGGNKTVTSNLTITPKLSLTNILAIAILITLLVALYLTFFR